MTADALDLDTATDAQVLHSLTQIFQEIIDNPPKTEARVASFVERITLHMKRLGLPIPPDVVAYTHQRTGAA
jgi:hypothetical protein